jgi:CheY-like chemotaxis protein
LILVVDDEAAVRGVLQRTLEKHGYRVIAAAEGNEALALFTQHAAEVKAVITDMMMPGMEGPALIRALRLLEPRLCVLGMTGLGEQASVKGLENLELPVSLTKPFAVAELLAALHRVITAPGQCPPAS